MVFWAQTWENSPAGSARRLCRKLPWSRTHLLPQLGRRQSPIQALLLHIPTFWVELCSIVMILSFSKSLIPASNRSIFSTPALVTDGIPVNVNISLRHAPTKVARPETSPKADLSWRNVEKKLSKVEKWNLRCFHWCDRESNPSEKPHCSSFRLHSKCLCGSCNPRPGKIKRFSLFLWFSITSRTPIRRCCPPFSMMRGPPESPLHASVTIPSVTDAVYNHSSSTCTYKDKHLPELQKVT